MKQYKQYIIGLLILSSISAIYLISMYFGQVQDNEILNATVINNQFQNIREEIMINVLSAVKALFQKGF